MKSLVKKVYWKHLWEGRKNEKDYRENDNTDDIELLYTTLQLFKRNAA